MPLNPKKFKFSSTLAKWYIRPSGNWRYKSRGALKSADLSTPMQVLTGSLLFCLVTLIAYSFVNNYIYFFFGACTVAIAIALVSLYVIVVRIQNNLIVPLTHMRHWAMRMRGGNLTARLPHEGPPEFLELADDINQLSDALRKLTKEMQEQVEIQTKTAEQKSKSLEVLYDVASSINSAHNLEELLTRFLHTMKGIVKAEAATVRMLTEQGQLKMVASIGLDKNNLLSEHLINIDNCSCGQAVVNSRIQIQDVGNCNKFSDVTLFKPKLKLIAVPMLYRDETLGIYNLFVYPDAVENKEEVFGLLNSIGKHMGVAIAKARLEKQAHRLALMEERTMLSHELHDSLAQTLASLKMQVSVLDDSSHDASTTIQHEVQSLYSGLDKANEELRDLLGHFRTKMDERGLVPALEDCVKSFERENNISIFFQNEIEGQSLPPNSEVQVLHIVQEALSNIRKHSHAHNVRVMLKANRKGEWSVLVEDDGIGLNIPKDKKNKPGKHIGLNIMSERCKLLNGELNIESEPNEGTRVELTFTSSPYLFKDAANQFFIEEESIKTR